MMSCRREVDYLNLVSIFKNTMRGNFFLEKKIENNVFTFHSDLSDFSRV